MKVPGSSARYRQVTSLGAARGPSERPGLADKYITLQPGERRQLCDFAGPGRIVRVWLTLPLFGRRGPLRDVVCRMYWDGEEAPSVELPLGDLFGAAFGQPRPVVSARLVIAGGGYLCRFEMPFFSRAVVELENQGTWPVPFLFFQIGWLEEPLRVTRTPTFHAQWRRSCPTLPGVPHMVVEARGRGWLAGVKVDLQGRGWWLRPPLRELLFPRGLGLGLLEGWETLEIDDEPPLRGTGAEDYFLGGFYFGRGPFSTPTHGASVRSYWTARVSAWRLHEDDPVPFEHTLRMTLDHGLNNTMEGDLCSAAFWYQEEPHLPHPPLPQERGVALAWRQGLQLSLLFGVPVVLLVWAWLG